MPNLKLRLLLDYYVGGVLHAMLKPPAIILGKLLRRNHDLTASKDVTFVKLLGGGSLAIAYPSLVALREGGGVKRLRLLATRQTAVFGELLGIFDEIIVIPDRSLWGLFWGSIRAVFKLFRTDAVVDLEIHSRLSTILCLLTMARNRVGVYTDSSFWRRSLATHLIFYNRRAPVYQLYEQVAALFDCATPAFDTCSQRFRAGLIARNVVIPDVDRTDVALAPVCSDLARERMLRPDDWPSVLARIDRNVVRRVHVLGGPDDRREIDTLCGQFRTMMPGVEFINHAGQLSLEQSVTLLERVNRLICIDSALLHLARLMEMRTESYWGPTDPAMFLAPAGGARDVVHYRRIGCSPCVHIANVTPCRGNNICMRFAVDPECGLNDHPIWLAQEPQKKPRST